MFQEFLREHPLTELLAGDAARMLFPPAEDREAWERVDPDRLREIRELADRYAAVPYPLRPASGFLAFSRDGSRQADEQPYFTRRRKLCAAVMRECADPSENLDEIVDGIWLLCEESSWVISAHNVNPVPGAPSPRVYPLPDVTKPYVDLFSAQTGMILALTAALLGKRLREITPVIESRIGHEIRTRILTPFMETDDFWWMGVRRKDLNNWTPWIISNIMICAVLSPMNREALARLLTRGCVMLDRYLDVLPADGGCDEGAGYWNMAGGALLDCLTLLERVTGGRMTFWADEKIRNILSFPLKAEMGNGWFVNFADCDARPFISGERLETAGEKLGDPALRALGRRMRGTVADQLSDVPHFSRALELIFHPADGEEPGAEALPGDVWLPDLQLRVIRRGKWTLACKGGHNGENHNHNDVGSFILFEDGEPFAVDAGNMVYTAKTFSAERYTLWNVRGENHNVPVIGDAEQREGREHAARDVRCTADGMALDLSGAYADDAGVHWLRRAFRLSEKGLTVADEVELERPREVTWVFLLRERPAAEPGRLVCGRRALRYPAELEAEIREIPVTDPRMARNWPGSLWRVALRGKPAVRFRAKFAFEAEGRE